MRILNTRTGGVVAAQAEVAATRATRRQGLLGRSGLPNGAGLVITPCPAVHTIGMRFAIDVVFVDARGTVKKIVRDLPPWRIAGALSARSVIELAAGTTARPGALEVGDRLSVELGSHESAPPVAWEVRSAATLGAAASVPQCA
jgi:uncharacterized protein